MKPTKQCCVCHRICLGPSPRTGAEQWRKASRLLPITHGVCPACLPRLYAELAALDTRRKVA